MNLVINLVILKTFSRCAISENENFNVLRTICLIKIPPTEAALMGEQLCFSSQRSLFQGDEDIVNNPVTSHQTRVEKFE